MSEIPQVELNDDTVRSMYKTDPSLTKNVIAGLSTFMSGKGDGGGEVENIMRGNGMSFVSLIKYTINTVTLYIKLWPQLTVHPELDEFTRERVADMKIVQRDYNFIDRMDYYNGETKVYNEIITKLSKHSPNFVRSLASGSIPSSYVSTTILEKYSEEYKIPKDNMGKFSFLVSISPISEEGVERVIDLRQLCTELKSPDSVNSTLKQLFINLVLMRRMGLVHADLHLENILVAVHSEKQNYTFKVEDEKDMYFKISSRYIIKIFDWDRSVKIDRDEEGGSFQTETEYSGHTMMMEGYFAPQLDSNKTFDFVTIMCYLSSRCDWMKRIASKYLTELEKKYGPTTGPTTGPQLVLRLKDKNSLGRYFRNYIVGTTEKDFLIFDLSLRAMRRMEELGIIDSGIIKKEGLDKYKSVLFYLEDESLVMYIPFNCRLPFERLDYTPSLDALRKMRQTRPVRTQFTIPTVMQKD